MGRTPNAADDAVDAGTEPETLPASLTEAHLDFSTEEFKRTGLRGGLNWYRNIDRNWELTLGQDLDFARTWKFRFAGF